MVLQAIKRSWVLLSKNKPSLCNFAPTSYHLSPTLGDINNHNTSIQMAFRGMRSTATDWCLHRFAASPRFAFSPPSTQSFYQCRTISGHRSTISLPRRTTYPRMYPTLVVYPDGSTVTVRYHEPRHIIKLPLLLEDVSHDQELKRSWELRRLPKEKYYETADVASVKFDPKDYLSMVKNRGPKKPS